MVFIKGVLGAKVVHQNNQRGRIIGLGDETFLVVSESGALTVLDHDEVAFEAPQLIGKAAAGADDAFPA